MSGAADRVEKGAESILAFDLLAQMIAASQWPDGMTTRVVAIDGCGGAGKSELAGRLARLLHNAPIIQTDDFASWDEPIDWYPRMLEQVFEPLASGATIRYQRYDWDARRLHDWRSLNAPRILIVEGVTASRAAFAPFLAFSIWVDATRETRLKRGLDRDGVGMRGRWEAWMRAEDEYRDTEHPDRRADLVVAGDPHVPHDPDTEIVIRRLA
jgi:uridine kinase